MHSARCYLFLLNLFKCVLARFARSSSCFSSFPRGFPLCSALHLVRVPATTCISHFAMQIWKANGKWKKRRSRRFATKNGLKMGKFSNALFAGFEMENTNSAMKRDRAYPLFWVQDIKAVAGLQRGHTTGIKPQGPPVWIINDDVVRTGSMGESDGTTSEMKGQASNAKWLNLRGAFNFGNQHKLNIYLNLFR